jgi:nitrate reductase gamma subunit
MSTAEVATLIENHKHLSHDVSGLRQSVSNMNSSLIRIEKALMGDEEMMHTGIVKTMIAHKIMLEEMEQEIRSMKEKKAIEDKIKKNDKWWTGGIVGVLTAVGTWLVNYFFHK